MKEHGSISAGRRERNRLSVTRCLEEIGWWCSISELDQQT